MRIINKIFHYIKFALMLPIIVIITSIYALIIIAIIPSLLLYDDWFVKISGIVLSIITGGTFLIYNTFFKIK